ncbi:HD domain-containing phosphohydrolase [Chthonobacter rhizosphaerae]|uniref:HD domain-containing phosphohydrolase n=1 Tax=Chthonobacter rhizosphaerae TaxID=2735553 RepID=UPI0015EF5F07|nr:HD domain-containing phosphohydrolase [Chthonobacter rhizosphaerae]
MVAQVWVVAPSTDAANRVAGFIAPIGDAIALVSAAVADYNFPPQPVIVFDVDLQDPAVIKLVREALRRMTDPISIFCVNEKNRQQAVQTNALGAAAVITRPINPDRLVRTIRDCLPVRRGPSRAAARPAPVAPAPKVDPKDPSQSVSIGSGVLTHFFEGMASGRAVNGSVVTNAVTAIQASIDVVGLDQWLEDVRRYHTGTFQHCLLVTGISAAFARRLGLDDKARAALTTAAILHDIGKAKIPLQILDKAGKLTEAEFHIMKRHAAAGAAYLESHKVVSPDIIAMVRHHHEQLDGSGYPDGLTGAQISPLTRMLTIADVFAALIEVRNYKLPLTAEKAYGLLQEMARAGKLDTTLVAAFAPVAKEITVAAAGALQRKAF